MRMTKGLIVFVVVALIVTVFAGPLPAQAAIDQTCPNNTGADPTKRAWVTALSGNGVRTCVYRLSNGTPNTYVTWVNLDAGARIADAYQFSGTIGSASNTNPDFNKKVVDTWWVWAEANITNFTGRRHSIVNGAFFRSSVYQDITKMSFPSKAYNTLLGVGEDLETPPRRVFGWNSNGTRAFINEYTLNSKDWNTVASQLSGYGSAEIGFHPTYTDPVSPNSAIARTWVGIRDVDNNGTFESVFFLATRGQTHAVAYSMLRDDFKTGTNIQMDSGGSTQMVIRNGTSDDNYTNVIESSDCFTTLPPRGCRWVPHAYVIYEAP